MLTSFLPRNMENAADLRDAAKQGSVNALYELIQMDAKVLDRMDNIPFVETPLHIAASAGNIQFVREIMSLKPSFVRKLNQNGFTPMHLALQNNQTQVVLQLLNVDEDLVRVKGKEGVTPLHYVAQIGNLDLLEKFLKVSPKSLEDVTIRKETVMHIALKYNMYEAFRFLLYWIWKHWFAIASLRDEKLLGWQDDEGNTVLHIAVSNNQTEIMRSLLFSPLCYYSVDINAKNSGNFTALDILHGQTGIDKIEMRNMLRRAGALGTLSDSPLPTIKRHEAFYRSFLRLFIMLEALRHRRRNNLSKVEWRSMVLVVLGLLVTTTYQTTLSPPGGIWQDNYNATTSSGNSPTPSPAPAPTTAAHKAGTFRSYVHRNFPREGVNSCGLDVLKKNTNGQLKEWLSMFENASSWHEKLMNWKDGKGNTVLHIAASNNLPKIVRFLLDCVGVDANVKNLEGLTALDIVQSQTGSASRLTIRSWKFDLSFLSPNWFLIFALRQRMNMTITMRSMLLVVLALFITSTYQATLSPPGGVWQDNSNSTVIPNNLGKL
ncbi:ankyrin repeat-containing protein BDA1-like [Corylus avellana]|uniref:ankyrin repeat-containing protein BDA1-like n=1 Tax=Corylus avellana TaxID=13451 RepID=UPI00286B75F8|nr:ankyrin repeat-containing protein BDA1-like [Corylus avellana]